jgi:hypothetical protein
MGYHRSNYGKKPYATGYCLNGKVRFERHAHAVARANQIQQSGNARGQIRVYLCDLCGGYHFTSKMQIPAHLAR